MSNKSSVAKAISLGELTKKRSERQTPFIYRALASDSPPPLIPLTNLDAFLPQIYNLLRQSNRQVNLNALECLESLTRRYPDQFANHAPGIMPEIARQVDEKDLQKSEWALAIATNMVKINSVAANHVALVSAAIELCKSEIITESLTELTSYFKLAS